MGCHMFLSNSLSYISNFDIRKWLAAFVNLHKRQVSVIILANSLTFNCHNNNSSNGFRRSNSFLRASRFRRHTDPSNSRRPLFQRSDLQALHIKAKKSLENMVPRHLQARSLPNPSPHN